MLPKTVLFVFVSLILNNRERSGRVLDLRPRGSGFEPRQRHCVVSLSKNIYPSLVLVQTRKTHPCFTERLLMGHKESNKQTNWTVLILGNVVSGTGKNGSLRDSAPGAVKKNFKLISTKHGSSTS